MSIYNTNTSGMKTIELKHELGRYRLYVDEERFYIKGAGGVDHLEELVACGGNTLRTWHIDQTEKVLGRAEALGLNICAGLGMVPGRKGFDYENHEKVAEQNEALVDYVIERVNHPSILIWGLGNELELHYESPAAWDAVELLAKSIKSIDGNRLLMTTVAAVDKKVVDQIAARCPSIDILGINAYKALDDVAEALRETSWERPYIVTEWGPDGAWEVNRTSWGAEIEATSTEKAKKRIQRYRKLQKEEGLCLGSFAFLWGQKQEVTPTWYNIFDVKGRAFECVDAMREVWGGEASPNRWPHLKCLRLDEALPEEELVLEPGSEVEARVELDGLGNGTLEFEWVIMAESRDKGEGGDVQRIPPEIPVKILEESFGRVRMSVPDLGGAYRIFVYAVCDQERVAAANFPFWVA